VAGGWFFLMACEMFVLGKRDFRLPGLGSYLQTAASAGNGRAILWGLLTMIGIIVLTDQLVWRPLIAWAQKFKFENVEALDAPRSRVLNFLRRSHVIAVISSKTLEPMQEALGLHFARTNHPQREGAQRSALRRWASGVLVAAIAFGIAYAAFKSV